MRVVRVMAGRACRRFSIGKGQKRCRRRSVGGTSYGSLSVAKACSGVREGWRDSVWEQRRQSDSQRDYDWLLIHDGAKPNAACSNSSSCASRAFRPKPLLREAGQAGPEPALYR